MIRVKNTKTGIIIRTFTDLRQAHDWVKSQDDQKDLEILE